MFYKKKEDTLIFKRKLFTEWKRKGKTSFPLLKGQFIQFVCFRTVSIFLQYISLTVGNILCLSYHCTVQRSLVRVPFSRFNPYFTLVPNAFVARYSQDYHETRRNVSNSHRINNRRNPVDSRPGTSYSLGKSVDRNVGRFRRKIEKPHAVGRADKQWLLKRFDEFAVMHVLVQNSPVYQHANILCNLPSLSTLLVCVASVPGVPLDIERSCHPKQMRKNKDK